MKKFMQTMAVAAMLAPPSIALATSRGEGRSDLEKAAEVKRHAAGVFERRLRSTAKRNEPEISEEALEGIKVPEAHVAFPYSTGEDGHVQVDGERLKARIFRAQFQPRVGSQMRATFALIGDSARPKEVEYLGEHEGEAVYAPLGDRSEEIHGAGGRVEELGLEVSAGRNSNLRVVVGAKGVRDDPPWIGHPPATSKQVDEADHVREKLDGLELNGGRELRGVLIPAFAPKFGAAVEAVAAERVINQLVEATAERADRERQSGRPDARGIHRDEIEVMVTRYDPPRTFRGRYTPGQKDGDGQYTMECLVRTKPNHDGSSAAIAKVAFKLDVQKQVGQPAHDARGQSQYRVNLNFYPMSVIPVAPTAS